jgi:hypothetical protein
MKGKFNLVLLSILIVVLTSGFAEAQVATALPKTTPSYVYLLNGMPLARPPSGFIGSIYYNDEWSTCTFTILENNQTVDGYLARYNIYFDELDIKTPTGEKAIDSKKIRNFTIGEITKSKFINSSDYTLDDAPLKGFLQVLVDGPVPLFKRHTLIIKEPDYHPALNAGSHDSKIIKNSDLLYASDNKLLKAKGKKKILASFGDKASQVENYLKENPASFTEEDGLIKIFTYYNSLLTAGN